MDTLAPGFLSCRFIADSRDPHVLWRQVLGFVLWVGLSVLACGGPIVAMLCLALGAVPLVSCLLSVMTLF